MVPAATVPPGMVLSTLVRYDDDPVRTAAAVVALEPAGRDAVWVPEAYGFDSVSMGSCRSTPAPRP